MNSSSLFFVAPPPIMLIRLIKWINTFLFSPSLGVCHQQQPTVLCNGMRGWSWKWDKSGLLHWGRQIILNKHSPAFCLHLPVIQQQNVWQWRRHTRPRNTRLICRKTCGRQPLSFPAPKCNTVVNFKSAGTQWFQEKPGPYLHAAQQRSKCTNIGTDVQGTWPNCSFQWGAGPSWAQPQKMIWDGMVLKFGQYFWCELFPGLSMQDQKK